jgi:tripartite-type tricarboxylate transporter receptor subunit TctC
MLARIQAWAVALARPLVVACAVIAIGDQVVFAEEWPTRPIRIVVPYSAGGSGDIVAREIAQKLPSAVGGSVYVENRPGASGNIATEYVAKSAADGHTLLMASDIQFAIIPNFATGLPYKVTDFAPISLVANLDLVLTSHPSVAASDLRQLVELAKKEPGKINYGSTGAGSTHQLAMELLQRLGDFKLTEVPYRGSAQALPDLLSGQLQVMLMGIPQSLPYIRGGQLKGVAVGALQRIPSVPDVQTISEQGFPEFEANNYWCLYAPRATPSAVISRLQQGVARAILAADLRERFLATGLTPVGSTADELAARIAADSIKWARVIGELQLNKEK